MRRILDSLLPVVVVSLSTALPALAQAPPPTKVWTESASAGLTVTSGNSDTTTFNIGYDLVRDPKRRNLIKSDGLFLRGKSNGELTADRLALNGRDEFKLLDRSFVFGQMQYVRDQFKSIDYLVAPTGGIGYRLVDGPATKLSVDAGLGLVAEKNPGLDVTTTGAVTYGDKLSHQLTKTTTLTQSLMALHRTDDFADSLYALSIAVAAALTERTQLKLEFLDTYKNRIVAPGFVRNDVTVIMALVFKN
ncbi:MAG: DUF481 domain-containing protein [Vicinamibacterales bacterium]